jgi:hypothetical protein
MAMRIKDLRARLLGAHAEIVRRDDETRATFGYVIDHRNALLIERDNLIHQRASLLADRDALYSEREALLAEREGLRAGQDALRVERDALLGRLHALGQRFDRISRSPMGLLYRALCKLTRRRGA